MTTLTVTATQGGSTANGMILRIFVITGAKPVASQTGGALNLGFASNTNAWTGSVTTTAGSNFYGGASMSGSGNTPTGTSVTIVDTFSDTTNAETYVTFKALNVTSGATTRGIQASPAAAGTLGAFEVLAAGTLAEDSSAPALASTTTAITVTSASFTPPPGSLLVAIPVSDGGVAATTMTVTDNLGTHLNWTQKTSNPAAGEDYAGVWMADVPAGAGPAPVQLIPPGFQSPMAFTFPALTLQPVPPVQPAAAAAVNGQLQELMTKTHPRRYPARAAVYWIPVETQNATPANVPGSVQELMTKTHPRRYPSRVAWKGFVSTTTNPGLGATQDLQARVHPRRYPSRSYWRGFVSTTTNNSSVTVFTAQLVRLKRPVPSRAFVAFRPLRTTNPAPQVQPDGVIYRRRAARAVAYWTPVKTINQLPSNIPGSIQPLQAKTHPRRYPSRAFWDGFLSTTVNRGLGVTQALATRQPRRYPSRAVWKGFISSTTNPTTGNTQDLSTRQLPRRYPARAVAYWTPVETTNAPPANVPGSVQDLMTKTHPRRVSSRVMWRGVTARTTNPAPQVQPGGLIRRRSAARAVVIGRPPRGVPVIPVNGTAPKNLVIRHRKRERAYVRWQPVRTTNAPPPVFNVARSRSTVTEIAGMKATVTGTPDKATVTEVANSIPTVT